MRTPEGRWIFPVVELRRTVDGDTFDLDLETVDVTDLGFHRTRTIRERFAFRFRLMGIDAWESNQAGGAAATRFADEWIRDALDVATLIGETFRSEGLIPDGAFGRWLIDLSRVDNGAHLSHDLDAAGHRKVVMVGDPVTP